MKVWAKRIGCGLIVLGVVAFGLVLSTETAIGKSGRAFVHQVMVLLKLEEDIGEGQTFWCPMHPEVRRNGKGTCPI